MVLYSNTKRCYDNRQIYKKGVVVNMIKTDCHMHSNHSGDSDTPMEDLINRAIELNFDTICITEHQDSDFPYTHDDEGMFTLDIPSYYNEYIELKEKYSDRLEVLFGIELGLQPICAQSNLEIVKNHPFDFVIGSSHLCNGMDPYFPEFFQGKSEEEAYEEYFKSIIDNINVYKGFDSYGHLDYVVRYGPNKNTQYNYQKYSGILDEVLTTIIEAGKGIEINTSGLKYGLGQTHPCTDIIKRYKNLGGEVITVGSDAHATKHVGYQFDIARDILLEAGFEYYTVFKQRKPHYIKL